MTDWRTERRRLRCSIVIAAGILVCLLGFTIWRGWMIANHAGTDYKVQVCIIEGADKGRVVEVREPEQSAPWFTTDLSQCPR